MVVLPFGVRVLYKIRESGKKEDKFENEDMEGVWPGHNGSNEVLMGNHTTQLWEQSLEPHSCQKNAGFTQAARPNKAGQQCANQSSEWPWWLCRASGGISTSARSQPEVVQDRPVPNMLTGYGYNPRIAQEANRNEQICDNLGPFWSLQEANQQ